MKCIEGLAGPSPTKPHVPKHSVIETVSKWCVVSACLHFSVCCYVVSSFVGGVVGGASGPSPGATEGGTARMASLLLHTKGLQSSHAGTHPSISSLVS